MGGCLCLENDDSGKWVVCWLVTPDLLPEEENHSHPSGIWQMDV
jgi:hypothetical protein